MQAWQYTGKGQPIALNEVDQPTPQVGEVLISVKAAGLCHTDIGILEGAIPEELFPGVPHTLGHEVAGVVSALGEGATKYAVGDRVAAYMTFEGPGVGIPGGYASSLAIDENLLIPIPDSVPFPEAAAGTDAGMTPYHAVHTKGGVTAGTKVGIVGLGGLGFNGAQIAIALGAEVYAAEPRTEVHALAKELGVREVVSDASELAQFELDVIVDFAGYGTTTAGAIASINPGGRVVLVGLGRNESTIDTSALVFKSVALFGSQGGNPEDVVGYYELVASGKVKPVIDTIGFDEIGEGLKRVADGNVTGRLVAVMD